VAAAFAWAFIVLILLAALVAIAVTVGAAWRRVRVLPRLAPPERSRRALGISTLAALLMLVGIVVALMSGVFLMVYAFHDLAAWAGLVAATISLVAGCELARTARRRMHRST